MHVKYTGQGLPLRAELYPRSREGHPEDSRLVPRTSDEFFKGPMACPLPPIHGN